VDTGVSFSSLGLSSASTLTLDGTGSTWSGGTDVAFTGGAQYLNVYEVNASGDVVGLSSVQASLIMSQPSSTNIHNEVGTLYSYGLSPTFDSPITGSGSWSVIDSSTGNSITSEEPLTAGTAYTVFYKITDASGNVILGNTETFTADAAPYITAASYNSSLHTMTLTFSKSVYSGTTISASDFTFVSGTTTSDTLGTATYGSGAGSNQLVLNLSGESISTTNGDTINIAADQTGVVDEAEQPAASGTAATIS
jgi:hypothetical protein